MEDTAENKTKAFWSEDTEVLTNRGWVTDVSREDLVATFQYSNGIITFEPITSIVRHEGVENEEVCEMLGGHTRIKVLSSTPLWCREKKREKWAPVLCADLAEKNVPKKIPVSGEYQSSGLAVDNEVVLLLGLIFICGEYDSTQNRLALRAEMNSETAQTADMVLTSLNIKYVCVRYESYTVGNRNKKRCTYKVWYIDFAEPDNENLYDLIEPYLFFTNSEAFYHMSREQFKIFLGACREKATSSRETNTTVKHIGSAECGKIQALATLRGYKAIIVDEKNGESRIKFYDTNDAVVGGSAVNEKRAWKRSSAEGEYFLSVETNGGGIITRRCGCVAILGGNA